MYISDHLTGNILKYGNTHPSAIHGNLCCKYPHMYIGDHLTANILKYGNTHPSAIQAIHDTRISVVNIPICI